MKALRRDINVLYHVRPTLTIVKKKQKNEINYRW